MSIAYRDTASRIDIENMTSITTSFYVALYPNCKAMAHHMEEGGIRTTSEHIRRLIGDMDAFYVAEIEVEARNRGQHKARVMAEALHEMEWTRYLACIDD